MSSYKFYKLLVLSLLLSSQFVLKAYAQIIFTPEELIEKKNSLKNKKNINELKEPKFPNVLENKKFDVIEESLQKQSEIIKNDDRVLMEILEALTPRKTPANKAKESLADDLESRKNETIKEKTIRLPMLPLRKNNVVNKERGTLYIMGLYQKSRNGLKNGFSFNKINQYLPNNSKVTVSTSSGNNDIYRLILGYDFDDVESIEIDLPIKKSSISSSVDLGNGNNGVVDYEYSNMSIVYKYGFSAEKYFNLPIGLYGKIGGNIVNQSYVARYQGDIESKSKDSISPVIGFGASYNFDIGSFRLGVNYSPNFGNKEVFKINKFDFYLGFAYYP